MAIHISKIHSIKLVVPSTLTILLIFTTNIISQDFKRITKEHGLSSNEVFEITQDSIGRIWIATAKGLNSFDGYNVKRYLNNPNDTNSIAGNFVYSIYHASDNHLYIGTNYGLSIYNKKKDNFDNFKIPQSHNTEIKNHVTCIKEDSKNDLWFSGTGGLYKYDRKNKAFRNFFKYELFIYLYKEDVTILKNEGVPEYIITKLNFFQGKFIKTKRLFKEELISLLGQLDYNKYADTILKTLIRKKEIYASSAIRTFCIDKNDDLWLGLSNGSVVKVIPKDSSYQLIYTPKKVSLETVVNKLLLINNELWIGSIEGGKIIQLHNQQTVGLRNTVLGEIFSYRTPIFVKGKDNNIWIGTHRGLYQYNIEDGLINKFRSSKLNERTISSDNVRDVFFDKDGIMWVACVYGGVSKQIQKKEFSNYTRKSALSVYQDDIKVTSVCIDKHNNTWVGYYSGGVEVIDSKNNLIASYLPGKKEGKLGFGTVTSIKEDNKGNIWITTYFDGLFLFNKHSQKFKKYSFKNKTNDYRLQKDIFQIEIDSKNNLWLNTLGMGFFKINPEKNIEEHFSVNSNNNIYGLTKDWVHFLFVDKNNNLTYAIDTKVYQLDETKQESRLICSISDEFKENIKYIFEDSKQNLWIGTRNGLFMLKKKMRFSHKASVLSNNILSNYNIRCINEDKKNNIWLSTDHGIFKIIKKQKNGHIIYQPLHYTKNSGLPSNSFTERTHSVKSDGTFLYGSYLGLVSFHPENIKSNTTAPNIIFTDFKIFNETIKIGKNSVLKQNINYLNEVVLNHDQNFITIGFAAITYDNNEQNSYSYKMEGLDKDWNHIGTKREANYTNLESGEYVFKVKASNSDGIWNNKGISINIIVNPPFWKTNIAYVTYFLILISLLILFRLIIKTQESKKAKLRFKQFEVEKDNELNKSKLRFFTNVSHELRTPLSLILGPLESLVKEKNSSDKIRFVYNNAQKLLELTNQILDIRKLESGKMELRREKKNTVDFIQKVVSNFIFQAESKGINLLFKSEIEHIEALFDYQKIHIIISNLLSNAIKNTKEGGKIEVKIKYSELTLNKITQAQKKAICISVSDNGIGIKKDELSKIFDRFYQTKKNQAEGTGIGLALVKEITELHDGTIEIQSSQEKGSEFIVQLPILLDNELNKQTKEHSIVAERNQKPQLVSTGNKTTENSPVLLLIDDNEDIRDYLPLELQVTYRTITAKNGKEGLEKVSKIIPDIIISDIMMPEMDGIEFCKTLKKNQKTKDIPVILLTAYSDEKIKQKAKDVMANDFITKPFSPSDVKERLKRQLQLKGFAFEELKKTMRPTVNGEEKELKKFVSKSTKLIESMLTEPELSIEWLCKELGYSRTALYSKIKSATSLSPSEFIKLIRLKKSVDYFKSGKRSVSDVAVLVGFKTLAHFSRSFSNEFGMSPTEYLNQLEDIS